MCLHVREFMLTVIFFSFILVSVLMLLLSRTETDALKICAYFANLIAVVFKGLLTKVKKIAGSFTQTAVISCLTLQNWNNRMQPRYFGSKLMVNTFKLQLKLWCHKSEPMKVHIIGQSQGHLLNECIVMSYYLLPPVNHHQQVELFSYCNRNVNISVSTQFTDLKL